VFDFPSPNGGVLDGVLGMNFFWNRNLVLETHVDASSFLRISDPLFGPEVLAGDVDLDLDLDADDIDELFARRGGDIETADPAIYDLNDDFNVDDSDVQKLVEEYLGTHFGDLNLDGAVNLQDFATLKGVFGSPGGWASGDFDGNAQVDLADFTTLKGNFGSGSPAAASVPEPSSAILALLALAAAMLWIRSHRSAKGCASLD
jgi:hypothetical protein